MFHLQWLYFHFQMTDPLAISQDNVNKMEENKILNSTK
jgi:hypothetical protein